MRLGQRRKNSHRLNPLKDQVFKVRPSGADLFSLGLRACQGGLDQRKNLVFMDILEELQWRGLMADCHWIPKH